MIISLKNNQLLAQPGGSDALPLNASSDKKFFIEENGAELEFVLDTSGKAIRLIILLNGHLMEGLRT